MDGKLRQIGEIKMSEKLKITDQNGDLLLECEVGDEYHRLLLEVGLNNILKDAVEHWKEKIDEEDTTP